MRDLPKLKLDLREPEKFGNLAERLGDDERRTLATDLIELVKVDETSMSPWLGEAKGYLETVKAASSNAGPDNNEQRGANEQQPASTEMTLAAVIQFAARATGALLGEPDLARASEPGAEKLAAWVSSQVRSQDPKWALDTDPLVVHMAVTGLSWRKRAFDEYDRAFHSYFLPCTNVIVNADIPSIERAPRITHDFQRYPYEIERSIRRGHWVDYEPKFDEADPQASKNFYECDCWIDLDGDGIDEPWTITINRDDHAEVVKIAPRWSRKTIVDDDKVLFFKPIRRFYPYLFLPDPEGGFFPQGFGKLLTRIEGQADHLLSSIIDTAETEAQNGGVLAGGGDGLPATEIELKTNRVATINTGGRALSDMYQPFPTKSVSSGSVQVLEKLITLGDRISGTLNLLENAPASMTATLAKGLIDNGTQVQSAVHRRLVSSMTQEFHMFIQMADAYGMLPDDVSAGDASSVAVTADPQLATEMQRSAQASVYLEMTGNPVFNVHEAALRFCQTMRLPDPEKLVGQPQPPQLDPKDKMQGIVAMEKAKTERLKTIGGIAVAMTQAFKNMVDASKGQVDIGMATLQMAQLEHAVQLMVNEAQGGDAGMDGMAQQAGNNGAPGLPAPPPGADNSAVPPGVPNGPDGAGAG